MHLLNFTAEWHEDEQRMRVSLITAEKTHIEKFDREQWDTFIKRLDIDPLRVGGMILELDNGPNFPTHKLEDIRQQIKDYFRKVDRALRERGATDFLPEDTGNIGQTSGHDDYERTTNILCSRCWKMDNG